jgi:alpha-glucuronidase
MRRFTGLFLMWLLLRTGSIGTVSADDGSRLWLRAATNAHAQVSANKKSPTVTVAVDELQTQWKGGRVHLKMTTDKAIRALGPDGYTISGRSDTGIVVSAAEEQGLLYGAYHLLRLQETGNVPDVWDISERPDYALRILNHWDNLNGTVERGYAGRSLWKWNELPDTISPRYREYARANASIGLNGAVLNNVNAKAPILTAETLEKVKVIADVLRPYHIKVYLSVPFSAPMLLGNLATADPLDRDVRQWWKKKAAEIYALIPDFGGFLVKANAEGASGPQDFGRTHADGANMLADVLRPYRGVVMWRAFVYQPGDTDRAKQAYLEFMPLDGKFKPNVIIQVKNGPVDFQPREPFSPLFGAMPRTPVMIEFQLTQEYLGFSNHLAYLATLYKECLDADTYAVGAGSTVAKATDGTLFRHPLTAIAGVANTGDSTNWCGHHFAQANWYAFGRLAWNHQLTAEAIAREWLAQTFTGRNEFVEPVTGMMLRSREAVVDYMMPLGLHHIMASRFHYGPQPWLDAPQPNHFGVSTYYHRADTVGLGFNRSASGSNAVAQYFAPVRNTFNLIGTCDERYLLWFHHVPWDYVLQSGYTLWEELCRHYQRGVEEVRAFQKIWDAAEPFVDAERFGAVQSKLRIQARDAVWWKDACLLYFQTFSRQPIPYDIERPVHDLDSLMKIRLEWEDIFCRSCGNILPLRFAK